MKKFICFFILALGIISCSSEQSTNSPANFEFTTEYSATIMVGGAVGITEKTFKVGDTYKGIDKGEKTIRIRIAEHSKLNENCPNSFCYQEFLDVPRELLKSTK
ncbi:hypothetical protein [Flavobacterium pectinovorum]|uniref:Lipoprotein n=1 Tax=Flavobacterium pectinovorum TaxID=29533 RepID=A0A502E520_9FLAO|nr:hypothetical protein [Flavobacterium pectinovorum]TPG32597.1 hypothetical protein EAH81_25255 [Flavobacterium pectinovorum]